MDIIVVGSGYVGLVSSACFSEMGINVFCVDIDNDKIEGLKQGVVPIYEPNLSDMVIKNHKAGRLHFSTSLKESLQKGAEVIFCAVGTPPDEDGSADIQYVLDVARTVGQNMTKYLLFVTKSTVPVGTSQKVRKIIEEELEKRGKTIEFDVASNPEFLKEGSAIKDFMSPDRIVVGVESQKARQIMDRIYKPFTLNHYRIIYTDISSAEMIKYAANAMLATRISFMNDIANLCHILGADVNMVRQGIGSDTRIGKDFLYPGCGYGGSCFPKDVKALISTAKENGYSMRVLQAVEEVNAYQKELLAERLKIFYKGDLKDKNIAIWGLSFKPETDDMREAPSLAIIEKLHYMGCNIKVYDPIAMEECKRRLGDMVVYAKDMYDAVEQADALLLLTEWKEFRLPNWSKLSQIMRKKLVVDGRNIYDKKEMKEYGFTYLHI